MLFNILLMFKSSQSLSIYKYLYRKEKSVSLGNIQKYHQVFAFFSIFQFVFCSWTYPVLISLLLHIKRFCKCAYNVILVPLKATHIFSPPPILPHTRHKQTNMSNPQYCHHFKRLLPSSDDFDQLEADH